ncbi:MAG TPA: hypothetical protein VM869_26285, partial [Enhygromyxa sp.]|nr:hypothetical protein [Enhygromyxa sp.]
MFPLAAHLLVCAPEHFRRKLDAPSVLRECRDAMTRTLDSAAVELLRAMFDLADADVRPSLDL